MTNENKEKINELQAERNEIKQLIKSKKIRRKEIMAELRILKEEA